MRAQPGCTCCEDGNRSRRDAGANRVTLVRTLLGIGLLVAIVVVYFFVVGLADGSVSSFNMSLWLGLLAAVAAAAGY